MMNNLWAWRHGGAWGVNNVNIVVLNHWRHRTQLILMLDKSMLFLWSKWTDHWHVGVNIF
jgi:hypothetical protein